MLITMCACSARKAAIDKGVTYVENKDQSMVILSPEYLRTILHTSGKTSVLIYVGLGNMQYRFEGSTMWTMIEPRNYPASLDLPLVIPCPHEYRGSKTFARKFNIYCVESQKGRLFEVNFEKRRIQALYTAKIPPDHIKHLSDGTLFYNQ
jgi:hypothetical protein